MTSEPFISSYSRNAKCVRRARHFLSTALLISGFFVSCYAAIADGSDYVPGAPIKFGSTPTTGTSSSGASSGPATGTSSSTSNGTTSTTGEAPADSANASGERGLGSLIRGVKHELRNSGLLDGVGNQGNHYSNSYQSNSNSYQSGSNSCQGSDTATGSGYHSAAPNWSQPGSSFGNGAPLNYVHQADGSYRANGPNYDQSGRYRVPQAASAPPSGNLIEYVSNNSPSAVDGDLENLIPRELHNYAYGKELPRNAPMNGAEGYAGNY